MTLFRRSAEVEAVTMVPGIFRRTLGLTAGIMLCEITLEPGAEVPPHQHPEDQVGYLAQGRLEFTIAGQVQVCGPGDGWSVPGNTIHSARSLDERCLVIEAFSPPRKDYA